MPRDGPLAEVIGYRDGARADDWKSWDDQGRPTKGLPAEGAFPKALEDVPAPDVDAKKANGDF